MNEIGSARLKLAVVFVVALALAAAWIAGHGNADARGNTQGNANKLEQGPPPSAQTPQQGGQQQPPPENPIVAAIRKSIAGKEDKPAEQVFKNIQVLKGVPAGRLLSIMERGYTRALGVRCDYCHVPGEWEKDDKATKLTARDMVVMNANINEQLKKIKTLEADKPVVNCSTCHRGQPKPGMNRPEGGPRPPQPAPTPTPATPIP
jgi:hypothetical protein